ncbi:MAG: APC family permease [Planctomycetes bacterium]|nr:APC family permease [Planctomycetota bacterium]
MTSDPAQAAAPSSAPQLERGLGLLQASALNVANMIGVGPFITIPIFIATMEGPQALVGWIVAAVLVLCDGLVWSELGAALPGSGGTYHFFRETYSRHVWGRALPFLFIWQFLFSGTLELASGYIGIMGYVEYVFPGLQAVPFGTGALAASLALVVTLALCRRIQVLGWTSVVLCGGTMLTVLIVIATGLWHFDARLIDFPPHAFRLDGKFATGLGGAMLIAIYDYLGYYNVCHLGDEVKDPGRTIPRAVMISVVLVAAIYLTMNLTIIGVIPWREAMASQEIGASFMERLFGRGVAVAFTWLILWTALACLFVMTLGYSRIPFAAARNGDFFRAFAYVHPRGRYPQVSLLALGVVTAVFCFFPLGDVINAAVTVRIAIQFIGQIVALHVLRTRRPEVARPFRMALYPLPSLLALVGWLYVLCTSGWVFLGITGSVLATGLAVYWIRERLR